MMIKKATAEYTGGGIWLFYGKFWDGTYFLTDDDGNTRILTADPSDLEISTYEEWQEEHLIRDLEGEERVNFLNDMLDYLTAHVENRHGMNDLEIDSYRNWFFIE